MQEYQLQLAMSAGELLLKSGGEIFRVEQTIEHIALKMGAHKVDSFVTPTALISSIEVDEVTHSFVRSIASRSYNLIAIVEINDLSRRFCSGEILTCDLASGLDAILHTPAPSGIDLKMALASGFGALGFAFIIGLRAPLPLLYATLNGFAARAILDIINARGKLPEALAVLLSSSLLSMMAFCYPNLSMIEQNMVNLGGLFLLLPGVTLSTSFRELASGDLLSGISRLAEALISLTMIAMGVICSHRLLPWILEVMAR